MDALQLGQGNKEVAGMVTFDQSRYWFGGDLQSLEFGLKIIFIHSTALPTTQ
jgi:hypothetical protein